MPNHLAAVAHGIDHAHDALHERFGYVPACQRFDNALRAMRFIVSDFAVGALDQRFCLVNRILCVQQFRR